MMSAPFNGEVAEEGEVLIIHSSGSGKKPVALFVPVGKDYAEKAKGFVLRSEDLMNGELMFCIKKKDQNVETIGVLEKAAGRDSAMEMLRQLIDKFC